MEAGRGIGGKPYGGFTAQGVQRQDSGLFDDLEQRQGEITGDAEDLLHAVGFQGREQLLSEVHELFLVMGDEPVCNKISHSIDYR